jgi:hypothetical protein
VTLTCTSETNAPNVLLLSGDDGKLRELFVCLRVTVLHCALASRKKYGGTKTRRTFRRLSLIDALCEKKTQQIKYVGPTSSGAPFLDLDSKTLDDLFGDFLFRFFIAFIGFELFR